MTASPLCESRLPVGSSASRIAGLPGKRASNCDALLLTAGELARQMFCPMRHSHALQRFCHERFAVTGTGATIRQR